MSSLYPFICCWHQRVIGRIELFFGDYPWEIELCIPILKVYWLPKNKSFVTDNPDPEMYPLWNYREFDKNALPF